MLITYLPVLPILRELYLQPRDMQRFRTYIATLTGGTDDVVLPIGVANPMAKEHAIAKIDDFATMPDQEGGAGVFAGARPGLTGPDLEAARAIIAARGQNSPYGQIFACVYGDAAAAIPWPSC